MKTLKQGIREYINYRCSLGFTLTHDKLFLNEFVSYMTTMKAKHITSELAVAFAKLNTHASRVSWAVRLATIRRFAQYWIHIDTRTEIPTNCLGTTTYQRRAPYIYSDDEIRRILECCKTSSSIYETERYSYFTWYGLMTVTGMRIGEIERLERNDLNLTEGIITIRNSKFGKSRNIPLHRTTVQALEDYLSHCDHHIPKSKTSRLFIDHLGATLSTCRVRRAFRRMLVKAGIQRTAAGRPRIMDFRHYFVMTNLIRLYRRRVNIDQHIPLLSTYLGHTHLRHTYWYITATPKLLKLIASRFEKSKRRDL